MLTYQVIGDVSATLLRILDAEMKAIDPTWQAQVHHLDPPPSGNPVTLSIFLYDIVEDPSARNRPLERRPGMPGYTIKKPPIALALRYMFTAWAGDRVSEHVILGRVIQSLYDRAILSGSDLGGGLAGSNEVLKLTLSPLGLEERAQIWQAIAKPYHLSINYEVRVVHIDAERETHTPTVVTAVTQPATGTP